MKKIALYYRVSSDDQKERDTIENQIENLRTYVEMKAEAEYEIYNEYPDNGISGTVSFENRPEGAKLLKDASNGLFNAVLVWKVDRFGRDTLTGLQTVELLRKYNIEIISITEPFDLNTPTGRFQFINYLNMAELERNNILDRMFLGATKFAKKGKWMGGIVPYGYTVNKDGYLEINNDEAKIIHKIFDLYTKDKISSLSIATYLNDIGISSSCGAGKGKRTKKVTGKWRASSIQRILTSTTYKGIHEYGKRSSRRKETILRKVPQIIEADQWEEAQIQKKQNAIMSKRNQKNREFLLSKLIKCKYCGRTYYGITYKGKNDVYSCSGKRTENKKISGINCESLNINCDMIEDKVWSDCLYILKNYGKYIDELKKSSGNVDDDTLGNLSKLNDSLNSKKIEKSNILNLYRKNIISEEEVEDQLKDIKSEESKIMNLISTLEYKVSCYKHENELINQMSNKLKLYQERLDNLNSKDKYDLVRLLVKRIDVETIVENGKKAPFVKIFYNLVKLDNYTDMGLKHL